MLEVIDDGDCDGRDIAAMINANLDLWCEYARTRICGVAIHAMHVWQDSTTQSCIS